MARDDQGVRAAGGADAPPRPARYDFANILLSGPCNLRCPHCIGRTLPARAQPDNLRRYPLPGLEPFLAAVRAAGVRQVTLTGSNTDPQLYAHEGALLARLREALPGAELSLHTNGLLAPRRPELLNSYDRATISVASLDPGTCRALTGRAVVVDLERIVALARIPLKVSVLVTERNLAEVPLILGRCRDLGLRRVVLRRRHGERGRWSPLGARSPARYFAGLPVHDLDGLEVTLWDFARATLRCLNLFGDGSIGDDYLLTRAAARAA